MEGKKFTITDPYTFDQLCANLNKFSIPPFQRAYAWRPQQINEFWESLINSDSEYFIGNIVFLQATAETENRYQVIDGQQRLFTISITLAILRNKYALVQAKNKSEEDWKQKRIKQIEEKMLFYEESKYPFKESLRILPAGNKENLLSIYKDIIYKKNEFNPHEYEHLDDNQRKFVKNYKTLDKLVNEYCQNRLVLKDLDEILEKVSNLLFIVIVCSSDNDAYEIFEGLNSTGVGLSVADLVKNAAMQQARTSTSRTTIESKWTDMETLFESTSVSIFPKFLRHQWISESGYISGNRLFREIKKQKLAGREGHEIVDYVSNLLQDSKYYLAFRDERYVGELHGKISHTSMDIIRMFRMLDSDQVYELMLSYFKKIVSLSRLKRSKPESAYTSKLFNNDLKKLWIFTFRAKILSLNPSAYENMFADHCKEVAIYGGENYDLLSRDFYLKLWELVDNSGEFSKHFSEDLNYNKDRELIMYLLTEIIKHEEINPKTVIMDPTIEHILPKEPKKWKMSSEGIQGFVDKIGNLTLLNNKDNSVAGNEVIQKKYESIYRNSDFVFNKDIQKWVKKFETDPLKAIKERGLELGEIANKIWSY